MTSEALSPATVSIRQTHLTAHREASRGGAIAAVWHAPGWPESHGHDGLDGMHFVIDGSWASQKGLISEKYPCLLEEALPPNGDHCHCRLQYLFGLRNLPDGMLTEKGRGELARVQAGIAKAGISIIAKAERSKGPGSRPSIRINEPPRSSARKLPGGILKWWRGGGLD